MECDYAVCKIHTSNYAYLFLSKSSYDQFMIGFYVMIVDHELIVNELNKNTLFSNYEER